MHNEETYTLIDYYKQTTDLYYILGWHYHMTPAEQSALYFLLRVEQMTANKKKIMEELKGNINWNVYSHTFTLTDSDFADGLNCSKDSVSNYIKKLSKLGLINTSDRNEVSKGIATEYTIVKPVPLPHESRKTPDGIRIPAFYKTLHKANPEYVENLIERYKQYIHKDDLVNKKKVEYTKQLLKKGFNLETIHGILALEEYEKIVLSILPSIPNKKEEPEVHKEQPTEEPPTPVEDEQTDTEKNIIKVAREMYQIQFKAREFEKLFNNKTNEEKELILYILQHSNSSKIKYKNSFIRNLFVKDSGYLNSIFKQVRDKLEGKTTNTVNTKVQKMREASKPTDRSYYEKLFEENPKNQDEEIYEKALKLEKESHELLMKVTNTSTPEEALMKYYKTSTIEDAIQKDRQIITHMNGVKFPEDTSTIKIQHPDDYDLPF